MDFRFDLEEILSLVPNALAEGETGETITGMASLDQAGPGDLSFLGNRKYRNRVPRCEASAVFLPMDYEGHPRPDQVFIRVPNPSLALALVCERVESLSDARPPPGVHPSAVVDPGASVDESVVIGPNCVVEADAVIGRGCWLRASVFVGRGARLGQGCILWPRVVLYPGTLLGDRVRLHAGAVLGSDGFGYETTGGRHHKVPQIGRVVVGDDVEIGANTTVDRARFDQTRIGEGTKIDNLVQIAHNVLVGKHCLFAAQAGISGSSSIGDYVMLGGQAGLAGHIAIGSQAVIGAQAGVSKDVPPQSFWTDTPAHPLKEAYRIEAIKRRLPELLSRIEAIEARIGSSPESPGENCL